MNKYLLDTDVVSELRKQKPHGAVVAWIEGLDDNQIFLSAVTWGGLQAGIQRTRKHDPGKAGEIDVWVDRIADSFQILAMDSACFREWGRLMSGQSEDLLEDGMIAATARIHNLTVATRNDRDFRHFGVRLVNPFNAT